MILLDTNALLWLYIDDGNLGPKARERIVSADRVCYSSVSVSEIVIKHMLRRLPLPGGDEFPGIFDAAGLEELPFVSRHARMMLGEPSLARHDPFDRLLVAQAEGEGADFLTADRTLLGMGKPWVYDARR